MSFTYFLHCFIAVNELNSKYSQGVRSSFKEKFSFSRSLKFLKMTFQIQELFKEFKDLHELCI